MGSSVKEQGAHLTSGEAFRFGDPQYCEYISARSNYCLFSSFDCNIVKLSKCRPTLFMNSRISAPSVTLVTLLWGGPFTAACQQYCN